MTRIGLLKRNKLTVNEHKDLGKELHDLYTRLAKLHGELYERGYRGRIIKDIYRAHTAVAQVSCDMDDILASEHSDNFDVKIYYPGGGLVLL